MKTFRNELLHYQDRAGGFSLDSLRFENCRFYHSLLALSPANNTDRTMIRNVHLKDCEVEGCDIGPAIFEDCTVDGLKTNGLLIMWGALFRRVVLKGDMDELKLNTMVNPLDQTRQKSFDAFRRDFYGSSDWALDISNARFREFDFHGIPAHLFRLDLETQAVVTRERALQPGWQEKVSSWNGLWPFVIQLFLSDGDPDLVLVAPIGASKRKWDPLLRGLRELRDLGVAEPLPNA